VLRKKRPDIPFPYKVVAYPFIPLLFLITAVFFLIFIAVGDPRNSGFGVLIIVSGIPLCLFLRRRERAGATARTALADSR
jgi:APA family basic amino acid/polyamine antiporter